MTLIRRALASCASLSAAAVLLWYLHCPLSAGPPMWIRSNNRGFVDSDNWNWGFTYQSQPATTRSPRDLSELVSALNKSTRVRVVGGGHSFAPLAATSDTLVDMRHFNNIVVSPSNVTVGAGVTIRALQHELLKHNRVVHGFGGGTHHQTIAGGLSTNLHGAQNCLFADFVLQMRVVVANGSSLATRAGDALFNAIKSGMGLAGVVYEVVLSTHERTCLRIKTSRTELGMGHLALYNNRHAAAEFKTSGHGLTSHTGVLTTYNTTNECAVDYKLDDYRDMTAAYTFDNWVAPFQVLFMPLLGDTTLFHDTLTNAFEAPNDDVIGVEHGWRGKTAPLFGEVFTEYAIPRPNCTAVMVAVRDEAAKQHIVVTAMTIKPLPTESHTYLAYAPHASCALEVYYMPCQRKLRRHLLVAQNIVYVSNGRSHLGKVYIDDVRPIYHRANMTDVTAFDAQIGELDPRGKFSMATFAYAVDYDALYVRAVLFRVVVSGAFLAGVVAIGSGVYICARAKAPYAALQM